MHKLFEPYLDPVINYTELSTFLLGRSVMNRSSFREMALAMLGITRWTVTDQDESDNSPVHLSDQDRLEQCITQGRSMKTDTISKRILEDHQEIITRYS